MDEGAGLLPAGLEHRLPARGVPAVPRGILGDRLGHGGADKSVVELRALRTVVPGHAIGLRPVLVAGRVVAAVVVDQIRRVGREQHRPLAVHQPADIVMARAVAAQQAVVAEKPQIASPRGRVARRLGDHDRRGGSLICIFGPGQQPIQFPILEAHDAEIDPGVLQIAELQCQQRLVPAGIQRDAVVSQHQGPTLGVREPRQRDRRHGLHPKQPGGQHAPVAGDQRAVLGNEDRVHEAELADRAGDLGDLRLAVGARIAGVGHQAVEGPIGDLEFTIEHGIVPSDRGLTPPSPFWPRMQKAWRAVLTSNRPEI